MSILLCFHGGWYFLLYMLEEFKSAAPAKPFLWLAVLLAGLFGIAQVAAPAPGVRPCRWKALPSPRPRRRRNRDRQHSLRQTAPPRRAWRASWRAGDGASALQTRGLGAPPMRPSSPGASGRLQPDCRRARTDDDPQCDAQYRRSSSRPQPQALLDTRAQGASRLSGLLRQCRARRKTLAKVTHPIQSWYTTATGDLTGEPQVDGGKKPGRRVSGD